MSIALAETPKTNTNTGSISIASASLSAASENQHYLTAVFHRRQLVLTISGFDPDKV